VQVPFAIASASLTVLALTRYGLLAGATEKFVEYMSVHVLVSLEPSAFFWPTMWLGVLLLALPAIVGMYGSLAGRSLVSRKFALNEGLS